MSRIALASLLASLVVITAGAVTASAAGPLAERGKVVFADDFARAELGKQWKIGIPDYKISDGTLKGYQARDDHGSSIGATLPLPDGNAIVELRFKFDGAKSINVNIDDKSYQGVHAGHISRVVIRQNQVVLYDDKEGVMRNDIYEMRRSTDPAVKAQGNKLAEGKTLTVPFEIEQGKWYQLAMEIVGDQMRVSIDGKEIGLLKSAGLTHPTKPDLRIGVWGKDGYIDDLKIYSVANAASKG